MAKTTIQDKQWIRDRIQLYAGVKTNDKIAEICEVAPSTIRKLAVEIGVTLELKVKIDEREKAKEFISKNHHHYTAREITDLLEKPINTIYYLGWVLGLKFKSAQNKRAVVETNKKIFNVFERENWLV